MRWIKSNLLARQVHFLNIGEISGRRQTTLSSELRMKDD